MSEMSEIKDKIHKMKQGEVLFINGYEVKCNDGHFPDLLIFLNKKFVRLYIDSYKGYDSAAVFVSKKRIKKNRKARS